MLNITPNKATLGATVEGLNLEQPLSNAQRGVLLEALGHYGVLRFPGQLLQTAALKAFAANFGTLEINVAGAFQDPKHPEVMTLSNVVENGKPIGLPDAGQGWHTDMSYSREIAFANVLYALRVPKRAGQPLGGTEFSNMHAAYDGLPQDLKERLEGSPQLTISTSSGR